MNKELLKKEINGMFLEDRIKTFKQDISDLEKFMAGERTGLYNPKNDMLAVYLSFDYDCAVMEQDLQFSKICVDYEIDGNTLGELVKEYKL